MAGGCLLPCQARAAASLSVQVVGQQQASDPKTSSLRVTMAVSVACALRGWVGVSEWFLAGLWAAGWLSWSGWAERETL